MRRGGALGVTRGAEAEAEDILAGVDGGDAAARSRADILNMLNRRERDAEDLELESCLSELTAKVSGGGAGVEQEIESLANQSLKDLKEM